MKLKKFEATTEEEAIEKVKVELGLEALILSVRKSQPKGIFKFFKKPIVEVTAAYDEKPIAKIEKQIIQAAQPSQDLEKDKLLFDQMAKSKKIADQQSKIETLQAELMEMVQKLSVSQYDSGGKRMYENTILQAFYDALISQGVLDEIAREILSDVEIVNSAQNINVNLAAKIVYNKIMDILSTTDESSTTYVKGKAKVIMLMGPTGVGKTTTIAKLSSNFILYDDCRVGLITADTYRIAAVEQLKTYAEILGVDVGVIYEPAELPDQLDQMLGMYDVIFVDTAGRSHKNMPNLEELKQMIEAAANVDMQRYLVLSVTTKYEDLVDIINNFSKVCDFKLIFTKLDETLTYGSILNICYKTGKKVEYLTNGQNVPDDIEEMEPEKVTKALLGLEGIL